jgi:hypothetical protein
MKPAFLLLLLAAGAMPAATLEQYHSHDFVFTASTPGNPFEVELAGEFTGPGGARLRVPGFYDGEGVWKIRFSPTRPGEWSLRTTSSLEALNGKAENDILCASNSHPNIHGVPKQQHGVGCHQARPGAAGH